MPNKNKLILKLTLLNKQMLDAADEIEKFYPKSVNAMQLRGAASKVFEWSTDIQEELEEKN